MAQTVSDFMVKRLYDWGVRTIYGLPGDGINGFLGALRRTDGHVRFIQTRHEEIAAFCACAHAKFTDHLGVCMATSGPGAVHLLNGLYASSQAEGGSQLSQGHRAPRGRLARSAARASDGRGRAHQPRSACSGSFRRASPSGAS